MDVGSPSNFIRVMELFQNSYQIISKKITGYTVSDEITKQTIAAVYQKHNYLLDPHGAVAFYAVVDYLNTHPGKKGMILETAHPVKFPDTVEEIIGKSIEIPESVKPLFQLEKKSVLIEPTFSDLKNWLLNQ
jgi:threonine synthase